MMASHGYSLCTTRRNYRELATVKLPKAFKSSTQDKLYLGLVLKNQSFSDNPVILAIERYWLTSCKSRL